MAGRNQRVVINGSVSGWRPVTSGVLQGLVLGPVLFNIFISDIDDGIECILSKFMDDTKLSSADSTLEGKPSRGPGQAGGVHVNLIRFNKCRVLHLGWGNPKCI